MGFTSLPKGGVLRIFSPWKNPTVSAGFEPANLGTKGQNTTSRPPKPLNVGCRPRLWVNVPEYVYQFPGYLEYVYEDNTILRKVSDCLLNSLLKTLLGFIKDCNPQGHGCENLKFCKQGWANEIKKKIYHPSWAILAVNFYHVTSQRTWYFFFFFCKLYLYKSNTNTAGYGGDGGMCFVAIRRPHVRVIQPSRMGCQAP